MEKMKEREDYLPLALDWEENEEEKEDIVMKQLMFFTKQQ